MRACASMGVSEIWGTVPYWEPYYQGILRICGLNRGALIFTNPQTPDPGKCSIVLGLRLAFSVSPLNPLARHKP